MNWRDRIVCNPDILVGKPTIKGTRISVEIILQGFASGWSTEDVLEAYPHLVADDVLAALACAAEIVHAHRFAPLPESDDVTGITGEPPVALPSPDVVILARSAQASFPRGGEVSVRDEFDATRSEWDERNPDSRHE